jgi:DNA-binding response OmpR family regulator/nitrogen-specific signal transduction histidine kinase
LEQVKLKQKEEIDKLKSHFFANISHEFRTPLTLILGPAEKIISESKEKETQKQLILIKRNASRLLGLVSQLLDLSKLESGKLELQASKGNIVMFVKGILMSFESLSEQRHIQLKFTASRNNIELFFDRDKMATILINLFNNAFKFTPKDGEIIVMISESVLPSDRSSQVTLDMPKEVRISIKDTGIGISEDELPKLFDRFYQVDSSRSREYEGSGLGLALTKELVELHHGVIIVKSKLGIGSEFIVKLPVGREHFLDDEIIEIMESVENAFPGEINLPIEIDPVDIFSYQDENYTPEYPELHDEKNILLIVEDNIDVRKYIKDSLGDDFSIEEASNGEQGLKIAEMIIPDLIITDVMMPKMGGHEFTQRIKNDERTSHIPIIMLTAKSDQASKLEGLEIGADDYLIKPFDAKELVIRVKNLILNRKKLQEKFSNSEMKLNKAENKLSQIDEKFLNKVLEVAEKHLSDENFSIEEFSYEVGMGRSQLHRKIKALTGKSPSTYLRSLRLSKAKMMIEDKKGIISEIAYSVGFSSPAYFSSCFKEEFGYPPSEIHLK